jgi:hypothetical protein
MTKVVLVHLAKFMKVENFHKLDIQAVVKCNHSLVETTAVVTTCLVSVDNSQLVAEKIQSAFLKVPVVVPVQAKVEVVGHNVRQAEGCLVMVPV